MSEIQRTPQDSAIQVMLNEYQNNSTIRLLIGILAALSSPIGGFISAFDGAITAKIEDMRNKRIRLFFEELSRGSYELTEELIRQEEFLHAYFATFRAAVNTRRKEKIRLFARLLLGASKDDGLGDDKYEEFLSILDDISVRELYILLTLKNFERNNPYQVNQHNEIESDAERASRFWKQFENKLQEKYAITASDLRAILNRLNRTGLYENIVGFYVDYFGGMGKLTSMFFEFTSWVQIQEEDFEEQESV